MPGEFVEDQRQAERDVLVLQACVARPDRVAAQSGRCPLDHIAVRAQCGHPPLVLVHQCSPRPCVRSEGKSDTSSMPSGSGSVAKGEPGHSRQHTGSNVTVSDRCRCATRITTSSSPEDP